MHARTWKRLCLGVAVAALLPLSRSDAAEPPDAGIESRTFANGLKVLVWPDHDIPNVAMYTWFKAGGRNERPGITGIAHYFEHMMFNGTRKRGPGEFDRLMEANGGANNASTSSDVTVYTDWFPASALELIIDLESDRMANLAFDPKVVESERGVVYSERRSGVDDSNMGALLEQLQATAFVAHPYQFPVIGWPSDIEHWSMPDLNAFYKTYYAPNNATIVISGDVEAKQVFGLVEKYFAPIPAQTPPPPVTTIEPEQQGERRFTVEKAGVQAPIIALAYHVGARGDADYPVLSLVETLLGDGESSRLHQRLVEREQLAVSVGAATDAGFDPGLLILYAVLPPGGDPAKTEAVLLDELQRFTDADIDDAELEKARNHEIASFWRNQSTISGKARALGDFDVFNGDYRKLFAAPEAFAQVTTKQVRDFVRRVLRAGNRTVGVIREAAPATTETSK